MSIEQISNYTFAAIAVEVKPTASSTAKSPQMRLTVNQNFEASLFTFLKVRYTNRLHYNCKPSGP
jgi:hypothetical protein